MQAARLAVLLFLASFLAMAQSERGNITGIVTDPSGASVAAAELSIVQRDTNATTKAVTTATGEYNVPNLRPRRATAIGPGDGTGRGFGNSGHDSDR
ncbi:MAG: carboxypeptidase regulatory-like domain-containing protein [Acidobacteria bacterium]|nr:carboxypeptidase regulatory-like domain-containing protein [Acidobacteriota bacterium]